ncbi:hypothetical protein M406DRAFT_96483 [Cryphonectria parasitica EP155]|uniref:Uncharacterized protein n=1 Tax=Cryphonectria parasitica (strain ATCC 38755 / EP155) TaxID=660469 RepID=A0A9P4YBH3_CRYP1|nr:uncharacterized protein M406DRAFT_96483 [Cryphonectria parasitica EP155]KAF3769620.1 hypothetical protein M406DRAFT_96483 [Cryphonectria parasitica EP155]
MQLGMPSPCVEFSLLLLRRFRVLITINIIRRPSSGLSHTPKLPWRTGLYYAARLPSAIVDAPLSWPDAGCYAWPDLVVATNMLSLRSSETPDMPCYIYYNQLQSYYPSPKRHYTTYM